MYFITRNNKIYNYIAHTKPRYRYYFTAFMVCICIIAFYGTQQIIHTYSALYSQELLSLEQKYKNIHVIEKQNRKITAALEQAKQKRTTFKNNTSSYDFFKEQLLFVLNTAQTSGLIINSYETSQEKDKTWFKKENAQCSFSGSLQHILHFLSSLKNAEKMISIPSWSLSYSHENTYTLQATMSFVFVA